jgi:hypothetical protein
MALKARGDAHSGIAPKQPESKKAGAETGALV